MTHPLKAQVGNLIVIFPGGTFLFVVRQLHEKSITCYSFIGDCITVGPQPYIIVPGYPARIYTPPSLGVSSPFMLFHVKLLLYAFCYIKEALQSEESDSQVD